MAATYNETLPTDLDKIRAILGDTDTTDAEHSDEHISAVLSIQGSMNAAISFLANELVARYASMPIKWSSDGTSMDYSNRLQVWKEIASSARSDAGQSLTFVPATYGETIPSLPDEFSRGVHLWQR